MHQTPYMLGSEQAAAPRPESNEPVFLGCPPRTRHKPIADAGFLSTGLITRWVKLKGFMGGSDGGWRDCRGDFSRPWAEIKGIPVIDARMGD